MNKYQQFKLMSSDEMKQVKGGGLLTATRYRCHYQYPGDPNIGTFFVCTSSDPVLQNCPEGAFCIPRGTCEDPVPPEVSCPVNP